MPFVPYSNRAPRPVGTPYITVDKQGRIYINRVAQEKIGAEDLPITFYLAYDEETGCIGFGHIGEVSVPRDTNPFRFNGRRAYCSAKTFLEANHILPRLNEPARRYVYVRQDKDGWHVFAPMFDVGVSQETEQKPEQTNDKAKDNAPQQEHNAPKTIEIPENTPEKIRKMIEVIRDNPDKSFRRLEKETGFKRKTLSRVSKEYGLR